MSSLAVRSAPEIFRCVGMDGIEYVVRPYQWSLERMEKYFKEFERFKIFTDDVPKTVEGFMATMMGSLWFECVNSLTDENVGFMYLMDFMPSQTEKRFLSATFHAITWDAKAAPRLQVGKDFIRWAFHQFKLHRLMVLVPLTKGGAIRMIRRLGFKDEGVMREAMRYGGIWVGILILSMLEGEVQSG